jgi:hypothetical protein
MSLIATLPAGRKWALAAAGLLILVLAGVWIITARQTSTTSAGLPAGEGSRAAGMRAQPPSGPGSLTPAQQRDLEQSIKAMRAVAAVEPATSRNTQPSVGKPASNLTSTRPRSPVSC